MGEQVHIQHSDLRLLDHQNVINRVKKNIYFYSSQQFMPRKDSEFRQHSSLESTYPIQFMFDVKIPGLTANTKPQRTYRTIEMLQKMKKKVPEIKPLINKRRNRTVIIGSNDGS